MPTLRARLPQAASELALPAGIDLTADQFDFLPATDRGAERGTDRGTDRSPGGDLLPELADVLDEDPVTDQGVVSGMWTFLSNKMIVSRMQDHVIETSDGDLHMLVNMGPGWGLCLFTSTDNGRSWSLTLELPQAMRGSTADIRLVGEDDRAVLVYTTGDDQVVYADLSYDTETNQWDMRNIQTAVEHMPWATSVNPTIAVSDHGRIWVGFAETVDYGVTVHVTWSDNLGLSWDDATYFDPLAEVGSARMIATAGEIGVVYATHEEIVWVTYSPMQSGWQTEVVLEAGALGFYASHFSTTVVEDDIYLANASPERDLSFVAFDGATGEWGDVVEISQVDYGVSSVQISAEVDGALYLTHDNEDTQDLIVRESLDGGQTWTEFAQLSAPGWLIDEPMRFEAPEHFDDELIVFQQIGLPGADIVQGLYFYVIDTHADDKTQAILREGLLEGASSMSDLVRYLETTEVF